MPDDNSRAEIPAGNEQRRGMRVAASAIVIVPLLILWVLMATDDDGNIALVRNELVRDASGTQVWHGAMGNTTDSQYRDIAVTVRFLDSADRPVGEVSGGAGVLEPGEALRLEAPLPKGAVAMQIYSLEWVTGRDDKATDPPLGPWAPWPFGHVQTRWP